MESSLLRQAVMKRNRQIKQIKDYEFWLWRQMLGIPIIELTNCYWRACFHSDTHNLFYYDRRQITVTQDYNGRDVVDRHWSTCGPLDYWPD